LNLHTDRRRCQREVKSADTTRIEESWGSLHCEGALKWGATGVTSGDRVLTFCASESRKRQVEKHCSLDVARSDRRRACTYTAFSFFVVFLTDHVLVGESLLCAKLEGLHRGLELVHAGVDGITSRGPRRACEQDGYERELGEHLVYGSASARQAARQSRVEKCRNISDPKDRRTQSSSSGGIIVHVSCTTRMRCAGVDARTAWSLAGVSPGPGVCVFATESTCVNGRHSEQERGAIL